MEKRYSGKSVLLSSKRTDGVSSRIIEDLRAESTTDDSVATVYFYVDGSNHQPLSISTFYGSFVRQLALQTPGLPPALENFFEFRHRRNIVSDHELVELYKKSLNDFAKIRIVIDALDECQEFFDLGDMIQMLTELLDQTTLQTNILVSSRQLEQLRRPFHDLGANCISMKIVRFLLDHGPRFESTIQYHALIEAIRFGHDSVAELLLNRGVDINAVPMSREVSWHSHDEDAYDTPLLAAIRCKNREWARRLLYNGALPNPQLPTTSGTPLLYAVWQEDTDLVRMLLERGAPPDQPGSILKRGKLSYPVLLASEKGNLDIISALLAADASINRQDSEGFSAVHMAAARPDSSCLRTLIHDHKADFTLRLQNGS